MGVHQPLDWKGATAAGGLPLVKRACCNEFAPWWPHAAFRETQLGKILAQSLFESLIPEKTKQVAGYAGKKIVTGVLSQD